MAKWWNKKTKIFLFMVVGGLGVVLAGLVTYYSIPLRAEQRPLYEAQNMTTVRFTDTPDAVIMAPLVTVKKGIVLYAGGRVEPAAYAYKMSLVAQSGVAVVIAKSPLHLAPLDWRSPSAFTNLLPSVEEWYVAGHSAGGVRACEVASEGAQFKGIILLGSYCARNISGAGIPVLSISGDQDKLAAADEINKYKQFLPTTTTYETLKGVNHAGFGNYGKQGGDGDMTIGDTEALHAITKTITRFVGTAKE